MTSLWAAMMSHMTSQVVRDVTGEVQCHWWCFRLLSAMGFRRVIRIIRVRVFYSMFNCYTTYT